MRRQESVHPNAKKNIFSKIYHDDNTLKIIAKNVIEKGNEVIIKNRSIYKIFNV